MMAPTHILVALLFVSPLLGVSGDFGVFVFVFGVLGGLFPDIDMFIGTHRKTLHYPIISSVIAVLSIIFVSFTMSLSLLLIIISSFSVGVSSHVLGDILGAGLEYKPWEKNSSKCVYNHISQSWISPTHIIGYDGSPRDLFLVFILTPVVFISYSEFWFTLLVLVVLGVTGLVYSIVRRFLPQIEEYIYKNTAIGRKLLHIFLYSEDEVKSRPWNDNQKG